MAWNWQSEWELYQDTHPDADWYDFEAYYWGDGAEPEDSDDLEEEDEGEEDFD